jgi:predicted nucleic acid-binding protein
MYTVADSKQRRAIEVIESAKPIVSLQVINEVCSVLLKRGRRSNDEVSEVIRGFYLRCTISNIEEDDLLNAASLRTEHKFSFWDSLHIAAALKSGDSRFLSEDMQDGLVVRGKLKIENPFR